MNKLQKGCFTLMLVLSLLAAGPGVAFAAGPGVVIAGVAGQPPASELTVAGAVGQPPASELTVAGAVGQPPAEIQSALSATAEALCAATTDETAVAYGSEWSVLGLARSGYAVPEDYFEDYYEALASHVKDCKGVLHQKKYTEYSRVALALTAAGYDPQNVAGFNLLAPLADFDKTVWQGINGPIYALLALDSDDYPIPACTTGGAQASRQLYVNAILERQLADGGFALSGSAADPDVTAMALQALAKYREQAAVDAAVDKALACLSKLQNQKGGFSSSGVPTCESAAQVVVALCELEIDINSSDFVKGGKNPADALLSFYVEGQGFSHLGSSDGRVDNGSSGNSGRADSDSGSGQADSGNRPTGNAGSANGMATEQALYALAALQRAEAGQCSLYRMDDAIRRSPATDVQGVTPGGKIENGGDAAETPTGLPGKDAAVTAMPVTAQGKTFADLAGHENRAAVEALAARGIINGMSEDSFAPERTMTRAEYAAIVVRGLGLEPSPGTEAAGVFTDITSESWYAGWVGTAYHYGIIKGISETAFSPGGTITRQEAAVMTARAAALCGLDTAMDDTQTRDMLAQFTDYTTAALWARPALAFCYKNDFLSQADLEIQPARAIKRCEVAELLYRTLEGAELL